MSRQSVGPRQRGRFTITLPDALREKCEAEARGMELSLSGYFRRLAELRHGVGMKAEEYQVIHEVLGLDSGDGGPS